MLYFLILRRPPRYTLFPYTTLFRSKMRLKKRLLAFSRRLHARIRKTRYMHKMRCLLINRRSLLLALISKHLILDRKSGSAGMPRPISYAVFCLKKKKKKNHIRNQSVQRDNIVQRLDVYGV